MVVWDGIEVVSHCLFQVPGERSVNLTQLFRHHPLRVGFPSQERRGSSLTLTHWLGSAFYALVITLTDWSQRLAKDSRQGKIRLCWETN